MEQQNYLLSFDDARAKQSRVQTDEEMIYVAHLMELVNEEEIEVKSRSPSPHKSKRRCNSNMSNSVSNKDVFISISSKNGMYA